MDPRIAWYHPEHFGRAHDLWTRVWETQHLEQGVDMSSNFDKPQDYISLDGIITFDRNRQYLPNSNENFENSKMTVAQKRKRENKASTYGINKQITLKDNGELSPWVTWPYDKCSYEPNVVGLHHEIIDFYEYMSPRPEEARMRHEVVVRIERAIQEMWPDAQVKVFGSFRIGLYLPTSDIDLVVFGHWKTLPLRSLHNLLIKKRIVEPDHIKILDKASVPIVKLTDTITEVRVDISFSVDHNRNNGVECAQLIELHPRKDAGSLDKNLGVLLIEFFELYGRTFNYMRTGIRIKNGGDYIPKEDFLKDMDNGHMPGLMCIEDPLNPGNDIGRSSYGAIYVRQAFEYAFLALSQPLLPQNAHLLEHKHSILGRVVRVTEEVVSYRKWVKETFTLADSPLEDMSLYPAVVSLADGSSVATEASDDRRDIDDSVVDYVTLPTDTSSQPSITGRCLVESRQLVFPTHPDAAAALANDEVNFSSLSDTGRIRAERSARSERVVVAPDSESVDSCGNSSGYKSSDSSSSSSSSSDSDYEANLPVPAEPGSQPPPAPSFPPKRHNTCFSGTSVARPPPMPSRVFRGREHLRTSASPILPSNFGVHSSIPVRPSTCSAGPPLNTLPAPSGAGRLGQASHNGGVGNVLVVNRRVSAGHQDEQTDGLECGGVGRPVGKGFVGHAPNASAKVLHFSSHNAPRIGTKVFCPSGRKKRALSNSRFGGGHVGGVSTGGVSTGGGPSGGGCCAGKNHQHCGNGSNVSVGVTR